MGFYRVKPGTTLGHGGKTYSEGDVVEIPDHVAAEGNVREKVDPSDAAGNLADPPSQLESQMASARAHERISLIEIELGKAKARVTELEDRLAKEKALQAKAMAAETAPPEKKAVEKVITK